MAADLKSEPGVAPAPATNVNPMSKHEAVSPSPSAAIAPGGSLRVAIVGLGAIGATLAEKLKGGAVPGIELVAVSARDGEKAGGERIEEGARVVPERGDDPDPRDRDAPHRAGCGACATARTST